MHGVIGVNEMGSIGIVEIGMYLVELEVLISSPGQQMYRVAIVCTLPQYEALRYPPDTLLVLLSMRPCVHVFPHFFPKLSTFFPTLYQP